MIETALRAAMESQTAGRTCTSWRIAKRFRYSWKNSAGRNNQKAPVKDRYRSGTSASTRKILYSTKDLTADKAKE